MLARQQVDGCTRQQVEGCTLARQQVDGCTLARQQVDGCTLVLVTHTAEHCIRSVVVITLRI